MRRLPTIDSVIDQARHTLTPQLWDYASSGAESETTLKRNRAAFGRLAFRARRLRDVSNRSARTRFLGNDLRIPVMLAPVGAIGHYHPDGALASARVAGRFGTVSFASSLARPPLEEVRQGTDAPLICQLYIRGNRDWVAGQLRRAEAAGCAAVCLTVDSAAPGHRTRNMMNAFGGPRGSGIASDAAALDALFAHNEALTWSDVEAMRKLTTLPFILKGITCAPDARLAIECGTDVVYVSNHGGRQMDHLPAAVDMLAEVVAEVGDAATVIVDGGFVHGSDVLKAIGLGASAVVVGKLMVWALAAAGEDGLEHVLRLLEDEITDLMAHIGAASLDDVRGAVLPSFAPPPSDWVGLGRSDCQIVLREGLSDCPTTDTLRLNLPGETGLIDRPRSAHSRLVYTGRWGIADPEL